MMSTDSNSPPPERQNIPWLEIGKGLFIIGMALIFFLVAQSMLRHGFCQGRKINHFETRSPIPTGP
jgi:hypothetical protein